MKEILKCLAEKLKSWPMWVAMGSLAVYIAKACGGLDISENVNGLLDVLLPILVGFGVVNNPNSRDTI